MRPSQIRGVVALYLLAALSTLCAQETVVPRHKGFPQDWSQHQVWFSRDGLLQHPEVLDREPRVLHQAMQRWQAPNSNVFLGAANNMSSATTNSKPEAKSAGGRDWSASLGKSHVAANMYPAKYTFNIAAPPDCNRDFAVFGLTVAGTVTQANLVGFNNLYSGTGPPTPLCTLTAPTVLFAYNITTVAGGKIVTSPFLSPDGTKIAFVESVAGTEAIFHVLTWTAGQGTIAAPATPGAAMTSVVFSTTSSDTISSPWMDYNSDIAYIGSDNGFVYKITGVFLGTPTLVSGNGWPATAGTARLTSPVLDSQLNFLLAGSGDGNLYRIDTTNPTNVISLAVGKKGRPYSAIVAPPAVDVTNGTTFVVDANDGTSAVLVQVDTASTPLTQIAKARIGAGGTAAAAGTAMFIYGPAADDAYFTNPASGNIRVCGTNPNVNTTDPWQYAFGFTGTTMHTSSSFSQQLVSSTAARCTGWTEFFNPNIAGGTDFFFFGLTQDCTGAGTSGCVVERLSDTSLITTNLTGGPTGIIVDNDSTAAQASSIYMTAVKFNAAYKFTQNGLK